MAYRQLTPGHDFLELVYTNMVQLRVVLTGLRRAELAAAKEADKVRAAAREASEAPAQHAPHGGNRRKSGADALRTQSQSIPGDRPPDPEPEESIGTESMADDEEQEAKLVLHAGLEHAAAEKQIAIEGYAPHVPDLEAEADAQAADMLAYRIARAPTAAER